MVNSAALNDKPAIDNAVSNAVRVFRAALAEARDDRFYGQIAVQFNFQDGKLNQIRADYTRYFKVT